MTQEQFEIVELKSGAKSLRLLDNHETFHPVIGPEAEARILHVEQHRLDIRCQNPGLFAIWDVGLGAAANALGAVEALADAKAQVEIHSFDKTLDPLLFALEKAEELGYLLPHRQLLQELIRTRQLQLTPNLTWYLHLGDFRELMHRSDLAAPHAVFYDPYSARGNQEMWSLEHFTKLRKRLDDQRECLLTNYTRSTAIRCTLLLAGFYVGIGTSIGEKEETSLASNKLAALDRPLSMAWLKKVPASQNANPIRDSLLPYGPMSVKDFQRLEQHPQFNSI
jgi:tRNA U34 5-methylaminomethyl-2-thiouridine-forming methyltransferase MnmC